MELSDKEAAFKDFDKAIEADAEDPDIYYHRGQVNFILGEFEAAIKDYEKSTSLDDTFIFSQVQYAVAHYKNNNIGQSAHETITSSCCTHMNAYRQYAHRRVAPHVDRMSARHRQHTCSRDKRPHECSRGNGRVRTSRKCLYPAMISCSATTIEVTLSLKSSRT